MITFIDAFPDTLILESDRVLLRRLAETDLEHFRLLAQHPGIWTYFNRDLSISNELEEWVAAAIEDCRLGIRFPLTIVDKSTRKICGSTSLGNISFYDKRIEIGWTWLGEEHTGRGINTHAKFLLLQYTFETLGFIRVEIKTDNLNERAKKALLKIGAKPEGVLRSHMQMFNNRRRDSIYYSILQTEWPSVRATAFAGIDNARRP